MHVQSLTERLETVIKNEHSKTVFRLEIGQLLRELQTFEVETNFDIF